MRQRATGERLTCESRKEVPCLVAASLGCQGHSIFVLALTTYADYINEDEQATPKVGRGVVQTGNVVPLERRHTRAIWFARV